MEKAVKASVVRGDSQQNVLHCVKSCGMKYCTYSASQSDFQRQLAAATTNLAVPQVGSFIWANTKEGAIPTDNIDITVYFYFDKQDGLIQYEFHPVWNGL